MAPRRALRLAALALFAGHGAARSLLDAGTAATSALGTAENLFGAVQTFGASAAAGSFMNQILTAMGAGEFAEFFVFDSLKSAFLVEEFITITDAVVSFDTFKDTSTGTVTVTPGDIWKDAASGVAIELGVSALFYVNSAAALNGTIPKVGVQILVPNVEGKVNVPARRRLLTTAEATAAGVGATDPSPVEMTLPTTRRTSVDPATLAGLTRAGFWDAAAAILPPSLRTNFTALLNANAAPAASYMARNNISEMQVDAAHAALAGLSIHNITIQQPQLPNILQTTVIPFVDVEFSFTVLDQANQAGANVRVTPFATRVGGNGQIFQSVKVVPFLAAFAQTTKEQLATSASQGLAAVSGLLQGNGTAANEFAEAQAAIFDTQTSPLPTVVTISFDSFIRAQVQVNGGDIALVF